MLAPSKAMCGSEEEGCSFSDQCRQKKILSDLSGKFFPSDFTIENRKFKKRKGLIGLKTKHKKKDLIK